MDIFLLKMFAAREILLNQNSYEAIVVGYFQFPPHELLLPMYLSLKGVFFHHH